MSDSIKDDKKDTAREIPHKIGALDKFHDLLGNDYRSYLLKKSEKLASAIYVITGFVPIEDPIRGRLRSSALDLVRRATSPQIFTDSSAQEFNSTCKEIAVLLEAAQYSGLISKMNADVICGEYAGLALFASGNYTKISEHAAIYNTDGLVPPKDVRQYKGHKVSDRSRYDTDESLKKSRTSSDGDSRKNKVINLVRKAGTISIKDALYVLSGVGEKTVQRLLLGLVQEGILEKIGQRRWSTYRLSRKVGAESPDLENSTREDLDFNKNVV